MARSEFLPFSPPYLGDLEIAAVVDVMKKGWLSSGPKAKAFEEAFAAKVKAEAALALNSCTAGLQLAMILHDVGPGTEVITTPMTFCATANVVEHLGGTVVLADVDPGTLLIDPREIETKITPRTKVITAVHYAGHPCAMPKINALAESCGAAVVEDAAHCLPSKIGDQWIGSGPNLSVFSFYATKNITTGEGGMMTGPKSLLERARAMALHGMSRNAWDRFAKGGNWKYDVPEPGYKFNMTDVAAALGLVQLERLDELFARRMQVVECYNEAFLNHNYLRPLNNLPGYQSSQHLYVIQLDLNKLSLDRDRFINELGERNIGTSVHYTPVHMLSYYAKKYGWRPESFPRAQFAFARMISLPLNSKMSVRDAGDVIDAVNEICLKFKR